MSLSTACKGLRVQPQSTVDFLSNWMVARDLRQQGKAWENPYDLGCIANWQVGLCRGTSSESLD